MNFRKWLYAVSIGCLLVLLGCGGGQKQVSGASIVVKLLPYGTQISCIADSNDTFLLSRTTGGVTTTSPIDCPAMQVISGDFDLSVWTLARFQAEGVGENVSTTTTQFADFPKPIVIDNGDEWVVLQPPSMPTLPNVKLQIINSDGLVVREFSEERQISMSVLPTGYSWSAIRWRWKVNFGTLEYYSANATPVSFIERDLGFWGALAMGDTSGDARNELIGTQTTNSGSTYVGYAALGLDSLFANRVFRDVRIVDLNGDGLDDLVSNVYAMGCTLIGIRQSSGRYNFSQPLRSDGSCIGGNGETILVADFDSDGKLDIVLPSYQRFDFLKNIGNGQFIEIADSLGISYPNYRPQVEGAVAVDLNFDGAVDIVIANEVLMNLGNGHFQAMSLPFGIRGVRDEGIMPDEGLSVADLDMDGIYDVIKNEPNRGLRVFWGESSRTHFSDAGYVFGGGVVMTNSTGWRLAILQEINYPMSCIPVELPVNRRSCAFSYRRDRLHALTKYLIPRAVFGRIFSC